MIQYEKPNMNQRDIQSFSEATEELREVKRYLFRQVELMQEHEKALQRQIDELKGV